MRINHFSLYILYFSWFTCSSFAESVSKVRVCFPSGVYIGTDRQCDKWHWINPFLNAFRDVSVPLVTHTRDLCKSRSLLLWETHLQTLRQTLKWADNWTNTVGGCRGKGRRGTAVRQMWGLDCCQAAPRHPAADPSSQYERGRKKERERCRKQQVVGGGKGDMDIFYTKTPWLFLHLRTASKALGIITCDRTPTVQSADVKKKKTNWIWNNLLCKHISECSTLTGLLFLTF